MSQNQAAQYTSRAFSASNLVTSPSTLGRDHRVEQIPTVDVALIEDDRAFRAGLRMLLDGTPGFSCVGNWASVEAARAAALGSDPDIVLLDIELPGIQGDVGVGKVLARWPGALVLMFTASSDEEKVFASLCGGASGYLLKSTTPAHLLEALQEAMAGGAPMSPAIARMVVRLFRRTAPIQQPEPPLTQRETDLLTQLAEGRSYQEAADSLGISINTVRNYIRSIYEKMQVHTSSEAVSKALRAGLI